MSSIVESEGFHLDPDSSRRYLKFGSKCWDRETDSWVPTRPGVYISRCNEWEYREFEHPMKDELDSILADLRIAQDERGLHLASRVPDDLRARLDAVAAEMPELQLWQPFVNEWEVAIYELTHLARGLFGVPIAEALHLRSSGRSGKDTCINLLELLAGSYSYTMNHAILREAPQGDGPSQSLAMIRARRIVSVREAPTGDKHKSGAIFTRGFVIRSLRS